MHNTTENNMTIRIRAAVAPHLDSVLRHKLIEAGVTRNDDGSRSYRFDSSSVTDGAIHELVEEADERFRQSR